MFSRVLAFIREIQDSNRILLRTALALPLAGIVLLAPAGADAKGKANAFSTVLTSLHDGSLGFEPNRGQAPAEFDYVSVGPSGNVYLKPTSATIVLPSGTHGQRNDICLDLVGGNRHAHSRHTEVLPHVKSSYFISADSSKWITDLKRYGRIRYSNVWPGIDVVYYGTLDRIEYDFVVAPGADPSRIKVRFTGADAVSIDSAGNVNIATPTGKLIQKRPEIYQVSSNRRKRVSGTAALDHSRSIGFSIGPYDHTKPLVIDPLLYYSQTRLPLTAAGLGVTVDNNGNAYVVGTTAPLQQHNGQFIPQGFVFTISPSGAISSFAFGGSNGATSARAVAVDSSANIYVTGSTQASDLTTAGFQPTFGDSVGSGATDAYMIKFSPTTGATSTTPLYSTYIGGAGNDVGNGIAVDTSGKAYVGGSTCASNFHITTGLPFRSSSCTGFAVKIDPSFPAPGDQRSLVYSTFVGGTGLDSVNSIAVDSSGNAYLGGSTTSPSSTFSPSTSTGFNISKTSTGNDGFILVLNSSGTANWITFVQDGPVNSLALDVNLNAYVTGQTTGFLQTNAARVGFQSTSQGGSDAFLQKYNTNATSSSFLYSTYIGGNGNDIGDGVAADASGNAFVVGTTSSTNFPLTSAALLPSISAIPDAFVTRVNTNVSGLASEAVSLVIGGDSTDIGQAVAIDSSDHAYVTGSTSSSNFLGGSGEQGIGAYAFKLFIGPAVRSDFNLDGNSDIVWQDPATGQSQIWLLAAPTTSTFTVIGTATLTSSNPWRIAAVADVNGDGHTDLVWQDPNTGQSQAWFLGGAQGNTIIGSVNITTANAWRIVGSADFDNNGRADLIWQDPVSGQAQIWYLGGPQGTTIVDAANLTSSNPWHIAGTADFNGDGQPDLLWQDPSTGSTQVWFLGGSKGNVVTGAATLTGSNAWRIVAIADFNGDGHPDVVWQDPSSGLSQVWFLSGAQGTTVIGTAALSGANPWRIVSPR